jgi:hypothetical protein
MSLWFRIGAFYWNWSDGDMNTLHRVLQSNLNLFQNSWWNFWFKICKNRINVQFLFGFNDLFIRKCNFYTFEVKFKSCFIFIRQSLLFTNFFQYFGYTLYNTFVAQWQSFRQKFITFLYHFLLNLNSFYELNRQEITTYFRANYEHGGYVIDKRIKFIFQIQRPIVRKSDLHGICILDSYTLTIGLKPL